MLRVKCAVAVLLLSFAILCVGCDGADYATEPQETPTLEQTENGTQVSGIVTLTKDNFGTEVLKSDKVVLVDFWAEWCGPCKSLAPIIEEIALENPNIKVGKINVDEQPQLADEFDIELIPTMIVFKDGKVVNTYTGYTSKENILKLIDVE